MPFTIKGIGSFVLLNGVNIVAIRSDGEYDTISVNEENSGYIRTSGVKEFAIKDSLDCEDYYYKVNEQLILVLMTNEFTIESLTAKVLAILSDLNIVRIVTDRQTILREEFIKENEFNLIKVVFRYEYDFLNDCKDVELECIC